MNNATTGYSQQARNETQRRDRLNRALRLLRRLEASAAAGDPVPTVAEIVAATGLDHPGVDDPAQAIAALLRAVTAEREAVNRRLRLARAMDRATIEDEVTQELTPISPLAGEAARLARISPRELDGLPYGAILMDSAGRIVAYNDTESRMARLPVEAVLGRNFFTEVAPCTRVKEFEGRFRALAAGQGHEITTFEFTFPFPFGAQRVSVAPGTVMMALLRR